MTRIEFTRALGLSKYQGKYWFDKAGEKDPAIKKKAQYNHNYIWDFTREEIDVVLSCLHNGKGATLEERARVEKNFIDRGGEKIHHGQLTRKNVRDYIGSTLMMTGTKKFLKSIADNPNHKCCSTCAYCIRKERLTRANRIESPWCSIYKKFCEYMGDVYRDYCMQWSKGKAQVWEKAHSLFSNLTWETEKKE